ncbi:sulfotransferase family protein [Hanstruepera marina]|uniref:sulfotransferase family protein n=1 Tax=Hanstruepera marina TaxID=2873265 RepID=UPI001CA7A269|nr:sulfotransferase [Hanstruepera marina]
MKVNFKNSIYTLPDVLILGAAKCGTTSLSQYLSEHSKVYIPKLKECRFLSGMEPNFQGPGDYVVNNEMITNIKDYSDLFGKAKTNQISCDASVDYFYFFKETTKNIKKYYGNNPPKMIILLRNPVRSAFSMYTHLKRDLRERLSLEDALKAQEERQLSNWEWVWQYSKMALYSKQVEFFLKSFDPQNIKIIIFEEFVSDIDNEFKNLLDFLGLEEETINLEKVHNKSGNPKSVGLQKLVLNKNPLIMLVKKMIPKQIKESISYANINEVKITQSDIDLLNPYFEKDIKNLELILNKNLDIWRN